MCISNIYFDENGKKMAAICSLSLLVIEYTYFGYAHQYVLWMMLLMLLIRPKRLVKVCVPPKARLAQVRLSGGVEIGLTS